MDDVVLQISGAKLPRGCRVVAWMMAFPLVSFSSQARGIKFYDLPTSLVNVGTPLSFLLEPSNPWDANCIAIWVCSSSPPRMLGHLAREDSFFLAPLLRAGFEASG